MRMTLRALFVLWLLATPVIPCSAFLVVGDGRVLFGNNEDYLNPETRVWFVPAKEGRRGVMYLGFDNGFPQGGMNDAGLAFDGFATGPKPMARQEGKRQLAGNPISEAMETCSTVEEVVELLEGVDLRPLLTSAMLYFADATGDGVVIEGDEFVRKQDDFQVLTNFYLSEQEDDLARCPRYAAAHRVLERRDRTNVAACTRALSAAAQRGDRVATLYSNVFDLKARTAHLYLFHDYQHPVVLDLAEELKRGARTLKLPELFPENQRFERYVASRGKELAERIQKRKGPRLPRKTLEAYAGEYELVAGGRTYRFTLTREKSRLVAESDALSRTDGRRVFYSSSETEFFSLEGAAEVTLSFRRGESGQVEGFTLSASGLEFEATREP